MKYTKLGKSDLTVSRICMGCMGFGNAATGQHSWTVDETQTREIIKHGLELGVNFYDTAIAYQNGTSEQFVGRALRDFAKRDDYVIATKFTPPHAGRDRRRDKRRAAHCKLPRPQSQKSRHGLRRPLHLSHVGLSHADGGSDGGIERRRESGQGALHRHLQLLCVAAREGELLRARRRTSTRASTDLRSLCRYRVTTTLSPARRSARWRPSAATRTSP